MPNRTRVSARARLEAVDEFPGQGQRWRGRRTLAVAQHERRLRKLHPLPRPAARV